MIEIAYVWTSSFLDRASVTKLSFPPLCNISISKVAIFLSTFVVLLTMFFVGGGIEDYYGMFLSVFFSLEGIVVILLRHV